jgi:hypothetical protein
MMGKNLKKPEGRNISLNLSNFSIQVFIAHNCSWDYLLSIEEWQKERA